ncbi:LOW QUALITY PROTEIN: Ty3-Gypsy protein [Phytophthora megakarya]|uniref:Ty3-Gypsy protein n=1 Tax=Phytophthora megakarya TaxID=4795 RepID=A0A225WPP3_9STRA|nr:LOW QUALITY PROTEIN: Ty3-Gypsy protein [Phytophthora megakarya]
MDFMSDLVLTKCGNFDAILMILDRLTKRAHFIPTLKTASMKDTAWIFLRDLIRCMDFQIRFDRDSQFLSAFSNILSASQSSKLRVSTAFKSSTDGQNEQSHRFIYDYLSDNWDDFLRMTEFAYNVQPHDNISGFGGMCHEATTTWPFHHARIDTAMFFGFTSIWWRFRDSLAVA